jgi:hypothetical protein
MTTLIQILRSVAPACVLAFPRVLSDPLLKLAGFGILGPRARKARDQQLIGHTTD